MKNKICFIVLIVCFCMVTLTNITFNVNSQKDFTMNTIEFALASSTEGEPDMSCNCSGGPGATSCACNDGIGPIEAGCSVSCDSGYYACCSNDNRCHCIKI